MLCCQTLIVPCTVRSTPAQVTLSIFTPDLCQSPQNLSSCHSASTFQLHLTPPFKLSKITRSAFENRACSLSSFHPKIGHSSLQEIKTAPRAAVFWYPVGSWPPTPFSLAREVETRSRVHLHISSLVCGEPSQLTTRNWRRTRRRELMLV